MLKSLFLFASLFFLATATTVQLDTTASQATWKGYKVTGNHEGTIAVKSGELTFEEGSLTGGTIVIDMASLKTTDLSGETAAKLEGHLKSPDFFGVEAHPTATLTVTKVVSRGLPGEYRVTADVTIKEATKSIKFNTVVKEEMGAYVATADIKLDRTDFDVRYGSGSFFDNLGDKTIYDEFDLGVKLVTKK